MKIACNASISCNWCSGTPLRPSIVEVPLGAAKKSAIALKIFPSSRLRFGELNDSTFSPLHFSWLSSWMHIEDQTFSWYSIPLYATRPICKHSTENIIIDPSFSSNSPWWWAPRLLHRRHDPCQLVSNDRLDRSIADTSKLQTLHHLWSTRAGASWASWWRMQRYHRWRC